MPNIREYDQSVSNQAALPGAGGTEASFVNRGSEMLANAVGQSGQILGQVQERARAVEDQNNNLKVQTLTTQAKTQWQEQYNQLEKDTAAAGGGADGFTDSFKQSFDDYKQKVLNDSGLTGRHQQMLTNQLDGIKGYYVDNAVKFQAQQGGIAAANTVATVRQGLVNLVLSDPTQASSALQQDAQMIDGLATVKDGKTREQLKREGAVKINTAFLTGNIDAIDRLQASPAQKALIYQDQLDGIRSNKTLQASVEPGAYSHAIETLQKKIDYEKERGDSSFGFQLGIANDKLATTGLTTPGFNEDSIRRNSKPEQVEQRLMQYRSAAAVGGEINATQDMSVPAMSARVNALQQDMTTKTGIDFEAAKAKYTAAVNVLQQKQSAMHKDPADFMASNDTIVADKAAQYLQNPGDPLKAQAYAEAQEQRQRTINPNGAVKILSQPMVDQFKQQLAAYADDPNGIEQQRRILTAEAAKWGDKWPRVASEYFASKALNNYQYVASGMGKNSQAMTDELIRAAGIKEADLKANLTIPNNYQNSVKTSVGVALTDFRDTLQGTRGNDAQVLTAYQEAAERVILARSLDGKDHSADAADVVHKLIGNEFVFKRGLRIPNDPAINPDQVTAGLDRTKNTLLYSHDFKVPAGFQGDTDEAKRKTFAASLRSYGKFVTKGDNSGVYFADSNGDHVRDDSGRVMQWSWADLQTPAPGRTSQGPAGSGSHTDMTNFDYGYGKRADGSNKGNGFMGMLRRPDGNRSSEISIGVEIDGKETEIPSLVPTLTKKEIDHMLNGGAPTKEIVRKAVEHARKRMDNGESPFAGGTPTRRGAP